MLQILAVTFPFFALVLGGFVAVRLRWMPAEAIPPLNGFVLFFALPSLLYRFGASTPIDRLLDLGVVATWLPCAMAMVAVTLLATRRSTGNWNDAAFGALVVAFPNSGYMGVPLLLDILGSRAAGPTIVTLTIDMVITSSVCVALSRIGSSEAGRAGQVVLTGLRGMASNPLPWSIVLGALSSATGLQLPALLMKPVSMLADAASPVALFTLGAMLARSQAAAAAAAHGWGDVPLLSLLKLALHPLLVWAAGGLAIAAGLPLDPFAATVMVLVAALPAASNVPIVAERFGADAGRTARVVLVTTAVAFFTFSGAVALLR